MARGGTRAPAQWIDELYEAALDADRWPRALAAIEQVMRAGGARLVVRGDQGEVVFAAGGSCDESGASAFDPEGEAQGATKRAARRRRAHRLAVELDGRAARVRFTLSGAPAVASLTLERAMDGPTWTPEDRRALAGMVPHIERALRLTVRFRSLRFSSPLPRAEAPTAQPELPWVEIEADLQRMRGLTPCEARVAARFAQGASIPLVARDLRVSVETIRTHLKRVYQKLGTTRQAELVHLLLTSGKVVRR